jgi:ABC-2 type transport system permease protein
VPIHDQGYRRYVGHREPPGKAWWVIARQHLLSSVKSRPFVILMLVAWAPFVVRAVQIYVASNFQQATFLAASAQTFRDFLDQQSLFVFLLTIRMAGLVADDKRANALQVYLSKPLTRVEYIAGKLVTLLVCLLCVTFAPAVVLLIVQILFAGTLTFLRENIFLLPAITLFSVVQSVLSAFVMLALSSLSKSRRFVAIMYAGLIFFTAAMYQALRGITGSRLWSVISPSDMLDVLGNAVFRVQGGDPAVPVAVAALVVVLLIGASIWVLERRIRGVEVVA